jgi:hypothetical protein
MVKLRVRRVRYHLLLNSRVTVQFVRSALFEHTGGKTGLDSFLKQFPHPLFDNPLAPSSHQRRFNGQAVLEVLAFRKNTANKGFPPTGPPLPRRLGRVIDLGTTIPPSRAGLAGRPMPGL